MKISEITICETKFSYQDGFFVVRAGLFLRYGGGLSVRETENGLFVIEVTTGVGESFIIEFIGCVRECEAKLFNDWLETVSGGVA